MVVNCLDEKSPVRIQFSGKPAENGLAATGPKNRPLSYAEGDVSERALPPAST